MLHRLPLLLSCCLLVTAAFLGTSCSPQSNLARTLARADTYHASGAWEKAEIEYLNSLRLSPDNPRAIAQLGLIYSEQGRISQAVFYLRKARAQQPDNFAIRAKVVLYYLAAVNRAAAKTEAYYILDHQPENPEAPILLAECAQQPKDFAEIQNYLEKLPTAKAAPVLTALASLKFRQQNFAEAIDLLQQALALVPHSAEVHSSLGTVYQAQKNIKAAESAFALAWQYAPVRSPRKLSYVRFLLQTGNARLARQLLTEILPQTTGCIPPQMLMIEIAVTEKKYDEALAAINALLANNPDHFPALMLSVRLRLAKGETDRALQELEILRKQQHSRNPEVFYLLGLTSLAQGNEDNTVSYLRQAIEIAPDYAEAILQLTEIYLQKGDAKAAALAIQPLLARHPNLTAAKFLLARTFVSQGALDQALSIYQEVANASPQEVGLLIPVALIYRQQKKTEEARQVIAKILSSAPNTEPAIELLVDLDVAAGQLESARQRVDALQARRPDKAGAYLLFAKIHLAEKNLAEAETDLLKAIELEPELAASYYLLAGIYNQTQQDQKALARLEQLALKNPTNYTLSMRIALLHEHLKNPPAAQQAYEKVLAIKPGFLPALNNLAYIYAAEPGTLARGLTLAQKARELAPFDPNIADTLGWLLYKQGQFVRARSLLLESVSKLPNEPVVLSHLGFAHYMMGELDLAQRALQRALQLNPDLPDKALIAQRLALLGQSETQPMPEQRARLEKALVENPADPVVLTLLSAILEKSGGLDQAKGYLTQALKINPYNVPAALALVRVHLARHETKQALELAKTTRSQTPDNPLVGHQLGRIAFQLGDYPWASSLLQECTRRLPDDMNILFDHAKAIYSIGRVPDAEEALHRILKTEPKFTDAAEVSSYLEMIALATQPTAGGAARINLALAANPTFVPALMALGANAESQSDGSAARQAYEKVLAQYPDFSPAKRSLALLAAAIDTSQPNDYELAGQAREAFPNDPELAQALGILSYRKGDFNRAATLLKESITRLGEDARRTYYLGMAQHKLKDKAARSTLQRSLELGLKDGAAGEAKRVLAEQP